MEEEFDEMNMNKHKQLRLIYVLTVKPKKTNIFF